MRASTTRGGITRSNGWKRPSVSWTTETRLYQILFKHNRPEISFEKYDNPLVRAAMEQREEFLESKADRLYSVDIFWVVMVDGSYAKAGLGHALSQFPHDPRGSIQQLKALFAGNQQRTLLYELIERDRLRLQQKIQSLSGQLSDLMTVELLGADVAPDLPADSPRSTSQPGMIRGETVMHVLRRLVNVRPSKIQNARLCDTRYLDWQLCDSELEAHRGHLRLDDHYVRVLTLKELPSETHSLIAQWATRHSCQLPCRHRVASGR